MVPTAGRPTPPAALPEPVGTPVLCGSRAPFPPSLAQMPASATWLLPSEARALPSVRPVSAVAAGLKDPDFAACTKVWGQGVPERGVTGLVPPEASLPGLWAASSPRVPVWSFPLCVPVSWPPPLTRTRDS